MKPTEAHLKPKRTKVKKVKEEKAPDSVETQVKGAEPTKLQSFIKKNKNKIIAVFTLVLGALAGDSVGVFDYIGAWFGF